MSSIFSKLFGAIIPKSEDQQYAEAYRRAIQEEAKVGGKLFGPVPAGHRREFFCLDQHTCVWHEEWQDPQGKPQSITTRYDITPNGIFKAQDGQPYRPIDDNECRNLLQAIDQYQLIIRKELAPVLNKYRHGQA